MHFKVASDAIGKLTQMGDVTILNLRAMRLRKKSASLK